EARLLPVGDIDRVAQPVLADLDQRLAGRAAHPRVARRKTLELARLGVRALVHALASRELAELLDERRAPALGSGREQLHDERPGVTVGDHARQAVGLAVQEAKRVGLGAEARAAQRERPPDLFPDEIGTRRPPFLEAPHAGADLRRGVEGAPREEASVARDELHRLARVPRLVRALDRPREHPGMAAQQRLLASGLEYERPCGALRSFSWRAGARHRMPLPGAGSRGAYRPAWSRCWSGRAGPGPRADRPTTAAGATRTSAAARAGAPEPRCRACAPSERADAARRAARRGARAHP